MARQDYLLEALKDIKEDLKSHSEKMEAKLESIEHKQQKQQLTLERHAQALESYNKGLDEHMRRTSVAEKRQDLTEETMSKISTKVEHLEMIASELNSMHNEAMKQFSTLSNWALVQKERAEGVKQLWSNIFMWVKRIGIAATSVAAVYGVYEMIYKVSQ